jgi:ubiquitin-conjugating enzyme E2 Q
MTVSISPRAGREKSSGKRHLALDVYTIMMGDTTGQCFNMEPTLEDSMDFWIIKLFGFDKDSNLSKDMDLLGLENVELEISFLGDVSSSNICSRHFLPYLAAFFLILSVCIYSLSLCYHQYHFAPPFLRVVRPRLKRGFVINGALCMELLTTDGWNPVNDIEYVIVSIQSLLVVENDRLEVATHLESDEVQANATCKKKAAAAATLALPCSFINRFSPPGCFVSCMTPLRL